MSLDQAGMKEWFMACSKDDIDYAFELMARYSAELDLRFVEYVDEAVDECEDLSLANDVLKRFVLN